MNEPTAHQKSVTVVGAGLTGLFTSYYLTLAGCSVTLVERSRKVGGLVDSFKNEFGLIETAANGILNSKRFEVMCEKLNLEIVSSKRESRKRYIFRGKARRWPLTFIETIVVVWKFLIARRRHPNELETVKEWSKRVFGEIFGTWVIGPALQGIYAGDTSKLSASLIFSRFFSQKLKVEKPLKKGTVAPRNGMGSLASSLHYFLKQRGVVIHEEHKFTLSEHSGREPLIICVGAHDCADLLGEKFSDVSSGLKKLEMLPLVTATVFFKDPLLKGFGCLFPIEENFNSLGVLFNSEIFENRLNENMLKGDLVNSEGVNSETWILGGAFSKKITDKSDESLLDVILTDRKRLGGTGSPLNYTFTRWPTALPHYTVEHEKILRLIDFESLARNKIYLAGNYLGRLGLSRILEEAEQLPSRIKWV